MDKKRDSILITLIIILTLSLSINAFLLINNFNPAKSNKEASQIDKNAFQAVFLLDGQAFMGKLSIIDENSYKLANVYYSVSEEGGPSKLVKLGKEEHKPQDAMILPKNSVLLWENIQNANQWNGALKTK
jgi:hypothetical protein